MRTVRERLESRKHINGTLWVSREKGRVVYHWNHDSEKRVPLGKSDMKLIRALAQQEYEAKVIAASKRSERLLSVFSKRIAKCIFPEDVYDSLRPDRRALVVKVDSDEEYARQWYEKNRRPKLPYKIGTAAYLTENGEYVKSKSELMIANRLKARGILYVYETEIHVNDGTKMRKPDFMVLNKRNRKVYFWEHLGMMDVSSYVSDTVLKLREYEGNGILLGRDLIVTMENKDLPLDIHIIDDMINAFLI
ncbi:MAG: hypothetical protein MJ057_04725 [Sphaerochaetaceae bacterium]|nr:hypothetical protein [Sphaerochaetaceae bacterium]